MGGLAARNFPWPTAIGNSPNVNPLVSATPGSPDQISQPNPITQPSKPPLAPPNPVQNPIQNPIQRNPIFGGSRSFYGM
jgi:hypothetical protein